MPFYGIVIYESRYKSLGSKYFDNLNKRDIKEKIAY